MRGRLVDKTKPCCLDEKKKSQAKIKTKPFWGGTNLGGSGEPNPSIPRIHFDQLEA